MQIATSQGPGVHLQQGSVTPGAVNLDRQITRHLVPDLIQDAQVFDLGIVSQQKRFAENDGQGVIAFERQENILI